MNHLQQRRQASCGAGGRGEQAVAAGVVEPVRLMRNTTFRASSPGNQPRTGQATIHPLQHQLAEVGLQRPLGLELALHSKAPRPTPASPIARRLGSDSALKPNRSPESAGPRSGDRRAPGAAGCTGGTNGPEPSRSSARWRQLDGWCLVIEVEPPRDLAGPRGARENQAADPPKTI